MAATNHERVGKALDLLRAGLGPFVERETWRPCCGSCGRGGTKCSAGPWARPS